MIERQKILGLLALLIAAVIGGAITPPFVRVGVMGIPPLLFTFLRTGLTVLLLSPIIGKTLAQTESRTRWKILLTMGITVGINMALFSVGISHTTIVASQLLYGLLPVTVPIAGYLVLREKISKYKLFGILCGLSGLAFLVIGSGSADQKLALGTTYGNVLIFIGVITYTAYIIFSKRLSQTFSPVGVAALASLGTTLFFVPLILLEGKIGTLASVSWQSWGALVATVISSLIFSVCFQFGLSRVSATTAAMSILLAPLFGALSGSFFFQETITLALVISSSLVIMGVLLSVLGERISWQGRLTRIQTKVLGLVWNKIET